jgi:hypothetical protein
MVFGRKPKSTVLKLIQGTYRPDRENPSEPRPRIEIPPCPKFLQVEARKQYRKIAKKLTRIGLMTELDDIGHFDAVPGMAGISGGHRAGEKERNTGQVTKWVSCSDFGSEVRPAVVITKQLLPDLLFLFFA